MSLMFEELSNQYVNSRWVAGDAGQSFAVFNPATGEELGTVPDAQASDAESAIDAAHQAFPAWRDTPVKTRFKLLMAWHDEIQANAERLAEIMTLESGKPITESRGEVQYAASFVAWFAEEAKRTNGDLIPSNQPDRRVLVMKQAVGVCTAITPWNFPLAMITRKCAPALAAGCTTVVKPAEGTPFSALALAKLAEKVGIPKGVFNVITAAQGAAVGEVLSTHPLVKKVSFTGSTAVGKALLKQAADTVKRVSMELGGNAPFIVFDDANLDKAIDGAMASKYRNSGQTCVCANRFLVHESIAEVFAEKLAAKTAELKVGNGVEDGTQIGPLINQAAIDKVERLLSSAVAGGAQLVTGGKRHSAGDLFFEPTVLTNVQRDMAISCEEIFGPVSAISVFKTEDEAIEMANNTPYGLAAYFYSESYQRIFRVAEALDYGMVGINEGILSNEMAPFGGVKESGLGREGSSQGIEEYLETKYLCLGGL